MSRKVKEDQLPKPAQVDTPYEPVGVFVGAKRFTTPTGEALPAARPPSRLAATLRGLHAASPPQSPEYTSPEVLRRAHAGSPTRFDSPERRRGRPPSNVASPFGRRSATPSASEVSQWIHRAGTTVLSPLHSRPPTSTSIGRTSEVPRVVTSALIGTDPEGKASPPPTLTPTFPVLKDGEVSLLGTALSSVGNRDADGGVLPPAVSPAVIHEAHLGPTAHLPSDAPHRSLLHQPWSAVCLRPDRYDDEAEDAGGPGNRRAVHRGAKLAAALVDLLRRADAAVPLAAYTRSDGASAVVPETCLAQFYRAAMGCVAVTDSDGRAAIRLTEDARHFIVCRGNDAFAVDGFDTAGRALLSAELALPLESALDANPGETRVPVGSLSRAPRHELHKVRAEIEGGCLANARSLRQLDRALFHLVFADETMRDPGCAEAEGAGALLGLDGAETTFQWLPSALTLVVYPSGAAVLRSNGLLCPSAALFPCAAWLAETAAKDTMPQPVPPRARSLPALQRRASVKPLAPALVGAGRSGRGATSPGARRGSISGSPAKGKKGQPPPEKPEPPRVEPTTFTVPTPTWNKCPVRLSFWMPETFTVEGLATLRAIPPPCLHGGEVAADSLGLLYLATALAVSSLSLGRGSRGAMSPRDDNPWLFEGTESDTLPNVYESVPTAQPAALDVRLLRSVQVDSAITHFEEVLTVASARGGAPLSSEISRACRDAVESLRTIANDAPYASLAAVTPDAGPSAAERPRHLAAPDAMCICLPPQPSSIPWGVDTLAWPARGRPIISIYPVSTHSTIRRRVGQVFSVNVLGTDFMNATGSGSIRAAELSESIGFHVAALRRIVEQPALHRTSSPPAASAGRPRRRSLTPLTDLQRLR